MCNIDIFILMKDRDSSKVIQYNSIGLDGRTNFTIESARKELEKFDNMAVIRNFKHYTDLDYESLKQQPRYNDFGRDTSFDNANAIEIFTKASLPPPVINISPQ